MSADYQSSGKLVRINHWLRGSGLRSLLFFSLGVWTSAFIQSPNFEYGLVLFGLWMIALGDLAFDGEL